MLWAFSIGTWIFVALVATLTVYGFYRINSRDMSFPTVAGMEFSQFVAFIPVTPFAFLLALRYSLQRHNWRKSAALLLAGGLAFNLGHLTLRAFTPYGYWDSAHREWAFAFWDSHAHAFRNFWLVSKSMFLSSVVDDVVGAYIPIVILAQAFLYYKGLHERELRATRLEEQLANARLETLKSQLQPHFLFNTLHSISALMLTDVAAADRMMTSLSDLLRMSLENNGVHLTTLNREIEFVQIYLEIEKARFEERLCVAFDIAPECLDAQVPHLLLQPLVENAVRHGISKLSEGGQIRIVAKPELEAILSISITNTGPGLTDQPGERSRTGVGLRVTRERLAALYGDRQSCEFHNLSSGGAQVALRLPLATDCLTAEGLPQGSFWGPTEKYS